MSCALCLYKNKIYACQSQRLVVVSGLRLLERFTVNFCCSFIASLALLLQPAGFVCIEICVSYSYVSIVTRLMVQKKFMDLNTKLRS